MQSLTPIDADRNHTTSNTPAAFNTPEARRAAAERVARAVEVIWRTTAPRQAKRTLWRDPSLVRWLGTTPATPRARAAALADERLEMVDAIEEAQLVSSLCTDGKHRPALDLDYAVTATDAGDGRSFVTFDTTPDDEAWRFVKAFLREQGWIGVSEQPNFASGGRPSLLFTVPIVLVPSSSGNFHLYIERSLTWASYREFLELAHAANLVWGSTVPFSLSRGMSLLLKPGLSKARVRAQLGLFAGEVA